MINVVHTPPHLKSIIILLRTHCFHAALIHNLRHINDTIYVVITVLLLPFISTEIWGTSLQDHPWCVTLCI